MHILLRIIALHLIKKITITLNSYSCLIINYKSFYNLYFSSTINWLLKSWKIYLKNNIFRLLKPKKSRKYIDLITAVRTVCDNQITIFNGSYSIKSITHHLLFLNLQSKLSKIDIKDILFIQYSSFLNVILYISKCASLWTTWFFFF